jgi:hypothetical protein
MAVSKLRDIPALQIIRVDWADGCWAVRIDDGPPDSVLSESVLMFPEYETARAFVEAVRNGMSPPEALEMLLGAGKAH